MLREKGVPKNSSRFHNITSATTLLKRDSSRRGFLCEFCLNFQNIFIKETLWTAASFYFDVMIYIYIYIYIYINIYIYMIQIMSYYQLLFRG